MHLWGPPRHPALVGLVDSIEYVEDEPATAFERMIPGGDASIVVTLLDDGFSYRDVDGPHDVAGACLAGPQQRAHVVSTRPQRGMVAVNFCPGGARRFLPVPVDVAAGAYPALGELWGAEGRLVRERLLEVRPARTLDVMESVLLARLQPPSQHDAALRKAVRALDRGVPVAAVVERFGTTAKPFLRRFRTSMGVTPKTYARVRRLQRLLQALPADGPVDWAAAAVAHGYYDQSHLIHEFTDIAGVTPSQYRPRSPDARNHPPAEVHDSPSAGPSDPSSWRP